jgi:hypothetical protein
MFGIFKQKKKPQTELEFFKQFFQRDFGHFAKIHFPILIYPELPSEPRNLSWLEREEIVIDNLISDTFKKDFETEYSNFKGERFEFIEKHKNGDINLSQRHSLVRQYLDSQPKMFLLGQEFEQSNRELGDFNVFQQHLDNTPVDIFKLTLEAIDSEFPDSELIWQRFTDQPSKSRLPELLKTLSDFDPLNHLDRIYDVDGNWELLQPEESSFLLIGTNSSNLVDRLGLGKLEIEKIEN